MLLTGKRPQTGARAAAQYDRLEHHGIDFPRKVAAREKPLLRSLDIFMATIRSPRASGRDQSSNGEIHYM
jgi:hypothetical protein